MSHASAPKSAKKDNLRLGEINYPMKRLPSEDIEHILAHTEDLWKEMRGSRIFITGGTGFFGKWLLGSFLAANDLFGLDATITVLSRRPYSFAQRFPHLAYHPAVRFVRGDVRRTAFPKGRFTHVIHGAVDASLKLIQEVPLLVFDTIVLGARRTLEFAQRCGARKFLLISSGAAYGSQPAKMKLMPEEYRGGPDFNDRYIIYGEAMRAVEALSIPYARHDAFEAKIARCFSFVGPYLPLDTHFAIGNFIRDALKNEKIRIKGDGAARRSYLYTSDLAIWLWTILLRGKNMQKYNVGSEDAVTTEETARLVAELSGNSHPVAIEKKAGAPNSTDRYVPNTRRARTDLGLKETIHLREAVRKTIDFYRQ